MATKTSLTIETLRGEITKQKAVTDINPDASVQELLDFSEAFVALTNDTYVKTTRIDKTDCDTLTPLVFKLNYNNTDYEAGATINIPLSAVNESNAFSINGKCVPSSTEYVATRPTYISTDLVPSINQIVLYAGGTAKFETKLAEKKVGTIIMNVHIISTNQNIADFYGSWTVNITE